MFLRDVELKRFLDKVKIDKETGCWEWTAYKNSDGYGQFRARRISKNPLSSHRVSYEHYVGEIPERLIICHKCDNPKCVNPDHLFVGTHLDNSNDKIKKGRDRQADQKGTLNGHSRLTELEVLEIVGLLSTMNNKEISEIYGTTHANISLIRRGKAWTHITSLTPNTNKKYQSLK